MMKTEQLKAYGCLGTRLGTATEREIELSRQRKAYADSSEGRRMGADYVFFSPERGCSVWVA